MNKSVSDIIEDFIMSSLDDDDFIELSRNDLAKFFSCVPSQINYVLNTRFTLNRGFVVESQRGGGGYIKLTRVQDSKENVLLKAIDICKNPINFVEACQLLMHLKDKKIINDYELEVIKACVSPKALNNPINMDNVLRSNILSQVLVLKMKSKKGEK